MLNLNKSKTIFSALLAASIGIAFFVNEQQGAVEQVVSEAKSQTPAIRVAAQPIEVAETKPEVASSVSVNAPKAVEPVEHINRAVIDLGDTSSITALATAYSSDRKAITVTLPIAGGMTASLTERQAFTSTSKIIVGKKDVTDSVKLSRLFVGKAKDDEGSIISMTLSADGSATGFATIGNENYTFSFNVDGFNDTFHASKKLNLDDREAEQDSFEAAPKSGSERVQNLTVSFAPELQKKLSAQAHRLLNDPSHLHTEACYVEIPTVPATGTQFSLITDPSQGSDTPIVGVREISALPMEDLPVAEIQNAIKVSNKSAVEIYAGGNWYIDVPADQSVLSILTYAGGSAYYPVTYYPNYIGQSTDTSGSENICSNPQSSGAESKVNGLENCVITDPGAGRYVIRPAQVNPSDNSVNMQMAAGYSDDLESGELVQIKINVLVEKDFIDLLGGNDDTTDYLANLIGYVEDTWGAQIQAKPILGDVVLLTENLPDGANLNSLSDYYGENYPNLGVPATVYLLTTSSRKSGGVAYLDGICRTDWGFSVSGHNGTVPASWDNNSFGYSWDPMVWSHEIGHNMNSPHTHEFGGIGGDERNVDHCYGQDVTALPGQKDSANPLEGGTPGQGNGTIMSYCHLKGGGVNTSFTFGKGHDYGVKPDRVTDNISLRMFQKAAGSPCLPIVQGTQTVPPAPTIETLSASSYADTVSISIVADGNSAVTQFKATCEVGGTPVTATAARSPITLSGLQPNTEYSCVATVTNAIGESPASDSKSFTTLAAPAVPDAPTISSIDRLNKALDVKFTAGAENRAKVSGYTATCGNQSASNTSSPVKVEGLAVGTEYSCTVVATNSEGNSVASAVMKQTTMPIPPAPTIRLIQPAIDSVKVIFSTVTDGAGSELDYTANCDGITNTGKKSPIQISGLNASTSYSCKVTATNLAGTSPDSTLVSVTTKAAGSANAAPVVQDLSYSTSPNTALNNQLFNGTDADSDTLVYEIVTPPTKGTVKLNDNANGFTYDPSWSSSSDVVTDTFTFKANDGIDDSNSATVTITIENKVPVASNATFDTYKNAKISGQVSATDVEGDNFSYEKLSEPSNGTLTLTSYNGNFTYTPTDGFNGTDTFTFKAVEGYGNSARDSNTATVTINVSANTLTYSLTAGWNLVGFMPELYGTYGLPSEFRDSQNVDLMWQYDYGRSDWDGYSPDWSQNNTFAQNEKVENVEDYEGIWFKAKKDFSVTFDEVPSSNNSLSTITYQTGWNLVSSPDGEVLDPATDLPHNEAVWLYRGGNWLFYSSDAATAQSASNDSYGTFTAIQPNEAVWVHKP